MEHCSGGSTPTGSSRAAARGPRLLQHVTHAASIQAHRTAWHGTAAVTGAPTTLVRNLRCAPAHHPQGTAGGARTSNPTNTTQPGARSQSAPSRRPGSWRSPPAPSPCEAQQYIAVWLSIMSFAERHVRQLWLVAVLQHLLSLREAEMRSRQGGAARTVIGSKPPHRLTEHTAAPCTRPQGCLCLHTHRSHRC